jgi:hypothetical protein
MDGSAARHISDVDIVRCLRFVVPVVLNGTSQIQALEGSLQPVALPGAVRGPCGRDASDWLRWQALASDLATTFFLRRPCSLSAASRGDNSGKAVYREDCGEKKQLSSAA